MITLEQTEKKTLYILLFAGLFKRRCNEFFSIAGHHCKKSSVRIGLADYNLVMLQPISNLMSIWWEKFWSIPEAFHVILC